MQVDYINYEITKRNLVLNIRLKDQAFEQIVAPPRHDGPGPGPIGQRGNPDHEPDQFPEHADSRRCSLTNGLPGLPDWPV